jgi:hypothetical protein
MPLPIILWGAAAALVATGVVKGAGAISTLNEAKEIGERAERRHRSKKRELEETRDETNMKFEELGRLKKDIFLNQIKHVIDIIRQMKDAGSKLQGFDSTFSVEEVRKLEKMVALSLELDSGIMAGAVGGTLAGLGAYGSVGLLAAASTGTAIGSLSGAAATNATLAWLGGGSLAAGGFGMAGGMLALGGIVAGPALAIGGFMLAGKAEEAMTQAREYRADVDEAVEKMELIEEGLKGLQANADEMAHALNEMVGRFERVKVSNFHDAGVNNMLTVGKALKGLLDINLINDDGSPAPGIHQRCHGLLEC